MNASQKLAGRTALVTGAGRGLGRAIAAGLTAHGAQVVAMSRTGTARSLVASGEALAAVECDLADRGSLAAGFEEALARLNGRIDILVNAAGTQKRHEIEDFPLADWDEVLSINLTAMFALSQLAGRVMLAHGKGSIINIASMQSIFGGLRIPAYAASKGGVLQLTRSMAVGWAGRGVRVNAIAPGYMRTDMNEALINDPERSAAILKRIPAGRWGNPTDMVGPCVFLASDDAAYVTGAMLTVDGGYSAS